MHFLVLLSIVSGALAAPVSFQDHSGHGQPVSLTANAKVTGRDGNIDADFAFVDTGGSQGTHVSVRVNKGLFSSESSNFLYHIHTNPVPPDGNCTGARGHLMPTGHQDFIVCDPMQPQLCQEGDLSGRNGRLNGTDSGSSSTEYYDPYLRFYPQPFSILGRSIVIHLPNTTRIACGNITSDLDGTENSDGSPNSSAGNYVTVYRTDAAAVFTQSTVTPYRSGTTDESILGQFTTYPELPNVSQIPNVVETPTVLPETIAGQATTLTLQAAVANPTESDFSYTGGGASALPSESDPEIPESVAMTV